MRVELAVRRPVNLHVLLTRAGYHRSSDGLSYERRLSGRRYPRFHLYPQAAPNAVTIHLDQKAPSYAGSRRHSGEYDGPVVETEARRLREYAIRVGA